MVWLRRTALAFVIGSAMISRAAVAQHGSSSLIHTVTVSVPPRVKVQVGLMAASVAPAVRVGNVNASTQGLSLSVSATEAWVLSIGSNASPATRNSPMRWSLDSGSGFSTLTTAQVSLASGAISTEPTAATVFFRNSALASSTQERNDTSPVVLTISAP